MANDVFNRIGATPQPGFTADSASMSFNNGGIADIATLLIQNMQANYQQAITRVFELSSSAVTFIQGRTQGTVSIGRIIGPAKTAKNFMAAFSSVCNLQNQTIAFNLNAKKTGTSVDSTDGCTTGSDEGFKATGCVIQGVSYSVSSENLVIQQNVNMQIVSLETLNV